MSTSTLTTDAESSVSGGTKRAFPKIIKEPLAIVAFAGIGTETLVAAARPEHALWTGGVVAFAATAYIAWFWFTTACAIRFLARLIRSYHENRILTTAVLVTATMVFFAYVVSWGIYLQTGRFANLESVRFMLFNWSMLEEYLLAADRSQVAWASIFCLAALICIPMLGVWIYRNHRFSGRGRQLRLTWVILSVIAILPLNNLLGDMSWQRRFGNLNRLTGCLNPGASLFASGFEMLMTEPIDDCLSESSLTSISNEGIAPPARRRNIIIVAVESLRHDTIGLEHQGRQVLPNINKMAADSHVWSKAYAQSTHSDYADLCLVSSLYPLRSRRHHFYHRDDPWPKQSLYDVLKPHGYSTAVISSQNEAWGCMDQFLQTENLDFFYHPETSDAPSIVSERDPGYYLEKLSGALVAGSFADGHTADVAIDWITKTIEQETPFYLSMNLQSSHFPYLIPDDVPAPFQPCELPMSVKFTQYEKSQVPVVRNAYYNGIHECDRQIGRLINHLKSQGVWENTIMVVTGENGEAFHENGCISHAGNPGEPTIHIASVMSAPGILKPTVDDYPFEHIDLAPTILGLMGSSTHNNFQGIDALSSERAPTNERFLFSHVLSPIAVADSVQYAGRWKLLTTQEFPAGQLFDLKNDSGESTDVSSQFPEMRELLATALEQWRTRQLAYYYLPKYYTRFYPPPQPTIQAVCDQAGLDFQKIARQASTTVAP